jgi:antitoxin component of MazEF toxin-antitoxin module
MVKLQKQIAYKYKNKKHYKHVIIIPEDMLTELGWKEGVELAEKVENGQLVLKPAGKITKELRFES